MKRIPRAALTATSFVIAFPFALLYRLTKSVALFTCMGELLSLVPDFPGSDIRVAFCRMTLKKCAGDVNLIGFGSFFTKPDAEIGSGVHISAYCTMGMVRLCDHVVIGGGTHVLSGKHQHGFTDLHTPVLEQKGRYEKLTIGENSWIGNGSVIMASLGRHCIVGAGSVVTKNFGDYEVIAGNPARVIRNLLDGDARNDPVKSARCNSAVKEGNTGLP